MATALAVPFETKPLTYRGFRRRLPNPLLGAGIGHLEEAAAAALVPPWPDLVIAAGRRTAPVARYLKRKSGAVLVQLMWPGHGIGDFDLIVVPDHDRYRGARVVAVPGTPHGLTRACLDRAAGQWLPKLAGLVGPYLTAILGGDSRHGRLTPALAEDYGRAVAALAAREGLAVLATTSPRTTRPAAAAFRAALPERALFRPYSPDPDVNPYLGFLGLAKAVAVTGDSASMCCEAAATGQPVFVFMPDILTPPKLRRLIASLEAGGWAGPLTEASRLAGRAAALAPLDTAGRIAAMIVERFGPPAPEP